MFKLIAYNHNGTGGNTTFQIEPKNLDIVILNFFFLSKNTYDKAELICPNNIDKLKISKYITNRFKIKNITIK